MIRNQRIIFEWWHVELYWHFWTSEPERVHPDSADINAFWSVSVNKQIASSWILWDYWIYLFLSIILWMKMEDLQSYNYHFWIIRSRTPNLHKTMRSENLTFSVRCYRSHHWKRLLVITWNSVKSQRISKSSGSETDYVIRMFFNAHRRSSDSSLGEIPLDMSVIS
jgi:hypothetical protein